MSRPHNFQPGPAALPLSVLEQAREDMVEFGSTGMSIAELGHRGPDFRVVHEEALALLRSELAIPSDYEVLLMQGGARAQFALVPMNFLSPDRSADYIVTGTWSVNALEEACVIGTARAAASSKDKQFQAIPTGAETDCDPDAAYLHITSNNTVYGTRFKQLPPQQSGKYGPVPLVSDMTSDLAAVPVDVSAHGLIYAAAQKNLGITGVTVVIVKRSWMEQARTDIPHIFRYGTIAAAESLYNTAPTVAIYFLRNMLQWTRDQGGVAEMGRRTQQKAQAVYGAVDAHPGFYRCPVAMDSRSPLNVVFTLPDESTESAFIAESKAAGMVGLKGHRSVGGIRASMYNGTSVQAALDLAQFMNEFARTRG